MNMKSFWHAVAKGAVKVAVYAAEHPETVQTILTAVAEAKK